nr:TRAP transporter large permease [Alloalcanivorax xenomutans]
MANRRDYQPKFRGVRGPADSERLPPRLSERVDAMDIAIPVITLLLLLMLSVPVAISLALAGAVGIWLISGASTLVGILSTAPGSSLSSYELLTIPMFVLMAEFMGISGISANLFRAVAAWSGRLKGGVGISTVVTGALFGAVSGSSTAAAATLAKISIPAMLEQKYDPRTAAGIVAMAGTIAMLIPPSVALIFYGLLSETNISALLIAGIVPGALVTLVLSVTIRITVGRHKAVNEDLPSYSWAERLRSLRVAIPFIGLFGIVTGLIYSGVATPVESSAIGSMGAFLYTVFNRSITVPAFKAALVNTCTVTAMIGLIVVCAQVFGFFVTMSGVAHDLAMTVSGSDIPVWAILAGIVLLYLFLGLFLDLISILILTVPVMLPIIQQLGLDPLWFGVVVILLAEVGIVTPPVGMNVFVVSKISGIPLKDCFAGVVNPIIAVLLLIIALVAWPEITLWLPNTMH